MMPDKQTVLKQLGEHVPLGKFSEEYKNDKEIVLAAVRVTEENLRYASENLKGDRDVVLEALKGYHN